MELPGASGRDAKAAGDDRGSFCSQCYWPEANRVRAKVHFVMSAAAGCRSLRLGSCLMPGSSIEIRGDLCGQLRMSDRFGLCNSAD